MTTSKYKFVLMLILAVLFGSALLVVPWLLGWRSTKYWTVTAALATAGAASIAVVYVWLTHRLWREAAAEREGSLMLQLLAEYDQLRNEIDQIEGYYIECANSGVTDPVDRFRQEMRNVDSVADKQARALDDYRFRVSRFFTMIRKLVHAGFLSARVVEAALDRHAIKNVFLDSVEPLDEAKAGTRYQHTDRDFYRELLSHYPESNRG